jgi:hypothetical protein
MANLLLPLGYSQHARAYLLLSQRESATLRFCRPVGNQNGGALKQKADETKSG